MHVGNVNGEDPSAAARPELSAPHLSQWSRRLPATSPETVRDARTLVGAALTEWRLSPVTDDALLCVSELVTNAVRHTVCARHECPPERLVQVTVRRRGRWALVLEVGDGDPCLPRRSRECDGEALGGRGLVIVGALADRVWWLRSPEGGKSVFARFELARYGVGDRGGERA